MSATAEILESGARAQSAPSLPLRHFDVVLALATAALLAFGWFALRGGVEGNPELMEVARRQLVWMALAAAVAGVLQFFDYHRIGRAVLPLYILNLVLLAAVLVLGRTIKGSRAWFDLGPFRFQPSETMKVLVALALAQWFALRPEGVRKMRDLAGPLLIVGAPMVLVLAQPDFGTAVVFGVLFAGMLFWSGAAMRVLVALAVIVATMGACGYPFLKPYQRERILVFVDPGRDPRGSGYNSAQARIAIGNGGLAGKGWKQGTQTTMRFLPEHHTDFIFASLAEQFGLAGMLAVLVLFGVVVQRMVRAISLARDRFGALIAAGVVTLLATHTALNIAMNLGLFPVTGLPLPLLSYGGSFMLTTGLMLGLAMNVSSRRFLFLGGD